MLAKSSPSSSWSEPRQKSRKHAIRFGVHVLSACCAIPLDTISRLRARLEKIDEIWLHWLHELYSQLIYMYAIITANETGFVVLAPTVGWSMLQLSNPCALPRHLCRAHKSWSSDAPGHRPWIAMNCHENLPCLLAGSLGTNASN